MFGFGAWNRISDLDGELDRAEAELAEIREKVAGLSAESDMHGAWVQALDKVAARQGRSAEMLAQMNAVTRALPDDA
ncbi:MAG: hypothetical protein OIF48_05065 [Silicimonas sp.]|nr:hypothetical protein [Silicimonas sp.]